jgi:hypothetical protein
MTATCFDRLLQEDALFEQSAIPAIRGLQKATTRQASDVRGLSKSGGCIFNGLATVCTLLCRPEGGRSR